MKENLIIIPLFLIVVILGCNTTEPEDQFGLTLEDVSCTEAWMKVTGVSNYEFILERNNVRIYGYEVLDDNTIYDDSLKPNTSYSYRIINQDGVSSKVTATTLDTTSHVFTWQSWTFGEHSSSMLKDVAIIDENNIWAVGEIYMFDSTGTIDPHAYNAVHWNGNKWEMMKLQFYTICGQTDRSSYPANAILAFNENDIWVCMEGSQIIRVNGTEQTENICLPFSMTINAIWGSSGNDIYVAGNNGSLAHYDGSNWTKIESGTELNINDIYGVFNEHEKQYQILAPASNILKSMDKDLLSINNSSVTNLSTEPISGTLRTLWFIPNRQYFVAGGGIYQKNFLDEDTWKNGSFDITQYTTNKIRGTGINDVAAAGGFGEVLHFNGLSWHSYIHRIGLSGGDYYGLDLKSNIIAVVGQNNSNAVIAIGKR